MQIRSSRAFHFKISEFSFLQRSAVPLKFFSGTGYTVNSSGRSYQMSKQQELPTVRNSENASLHPAFNACVDPRDLELQELDPRLLRYTRTGNENILPHSKYYRSLRNPLTEPMNIVTPWSPELQASRSNSARPEFFDNLRNQSFPPSPFGTPLHKPVPLFTLPKYTRVRPGEGVLVFDSSAINELSTNSFSTPEACRKQKSLSSDACASGSTSSSTKKSLYKTAMCCFWEERGSCRYGSICKFAHSKDELRTAPIRNSKYKTEICPTFAATGKCEFGAKCRNIHGFRITDNFGEDFNISTDLVEILSASRVDFEELLSTISLTPLSPGNRINRKRLPIFEVICSRSPP